MIAGAITRLGLWSGMWVEDGPAAARQLGYESRTNVRAGKLENTQNLLAMRPCNFQSIGVGTTNVQRKL